MGKIRDQTSKGSASLSAMSAKWEKGMITKSGFPNEKAWTVEYFWYLQI
jgi:hypothetical protein